MEIDNEKQISSDIQLEINEHRSKTIEKTNKTLEITGNKRLASDIRIEINKDKEKTIGKLMRIIS